MNKPSIRLKLHGIPLRALQAPLHADVCCRYGARGTKLHASAASYDAQRLCPIGTFVAPQNLALGQAETLQLIRKDSAGARSWARHSPGAGALLLPTPRADAPLQLLAVSRAG